MQGRTVYLCAGTRTSIGRYGGRALATMCVGVGQGSALALAKA
jgi:acetyl-CoA acetyltransferase